MSYSEKDGQVVLTMNREDYETLLLAIGCHTFYGYDRERIFGMLDRMNEGNPHYRPYQVYAKKL